MTKTHVLNAPASAKAFEGIPKIPAPIIPLIASNHKPATVSWRNNDSDFSVTGFISTEDTDFESSSRWLMLTLFDFMEHDTRNGATTKLCKIRTLASEQFVNSFKK